MSQGALFAIAMTVIVLRSPDAQVAAHLSSMAQGGGYILASTGPLFAGLLREWTGGWSAVALFCLLLGGAGGIAGWLAGRALSCTRPHRGLPEPTYRLADCSRSSRARARTLFSISPTVTWLTGASTHCPFCSTCRKIVTRTPSARN